jgi:hypothetical protein
MKQYRLPQNRLPLFKAIANATMDHLPNGNAALKGSKLYNQFSLPLGYANFNKLAEAAKVYGEGPFNASDLIALLFAPESNLLKSYDWSDLEVATAILEAVIDLEDEFPELTAENKSGLGLAINLVAIRSKRGTDSNRALVSTFETQPQDLKPLPNVFHIEGFRTHGNTSDVFRSSQFMCDHYLTLAEDYKKKSVFIGTATDVSHFLKENAIHAMDLMKSNSISYRSHSDLKVEWTNSQTTKDNKRLTNTANPFANIPIETLRAVLAISLPSDESPIRAGAHKFKSGLLKGVELIRNSIPFRGLVENEVKAQLAKGHLVVIEGETGSGKSWVAERAVGHKSIIDKSQSWMRADAEANYFTKEELLKAYLCDALCIDLMGRIDEKEKENISGIIADRGKGLLILTSGYDKGDFDAFTTPFLERGRHVKRISIGNLSLDTSDWSYL